MNCAAIPLLLGARILYADWISAVVIVLTVPLVPLFMILIGRYTDDRVREAQSALARLSGHMLELAKGLPVLVGLGRATAQRKALEDLSEEYRHRTMGTLRTAFLSALALELIATISVAVVAVFIGVRLVNGDMALEAGLLALILAPDCYLPLRELGTAHHASDEGRAALAETTAVLESPEPAPLLTETPKVPGLDGQKMSKSYGNAILLREEPAVVTEKIRTMQTDPARVRRSDPGNPEKCPVWNLHQVYSDKNTRDWVWNGCTTAGIGCLECKQPVIDAINAELKPIRERAAQFEDDPTVVRNIIQDGCEKASDIANDTMRDVRDAMGLNYS